MENIAKFSGEYQAKLDALADYKKTPSYKVKLEMMAEKLLSTDADLACEMLTDAFFDRREFIARKLFSEKKDAIGVLTCLYLDSIKMATQSPEVRNAVVSQWEKEYNKGAA